MKKVLIVAVAAVALAGSSYYLGSRSSQSGEGAAQAGGAGGGRRGGGAGFPGGGGGGFPGGGGGRGR